jgi:hypothetical protein
VVDSGLRLFFVVFVADIFKYGWRTNKKIQTVVRKCLSKWNTKLLNDKEIISCNLNKQKDHLPLFDRAMVKRRGFLIHLLFWLLNSQFIIVRLFNMKKCFVLRSSTLMTSLEMSRKKEQL